jgi:hypothetical protein
MASSAKLGIGVLFKVGSGGSPETFAELANGSQIDVAMSAPEVDVTVLSSPGRRREYIGGLIDGDTYTVNFYLDLTQPTQDATAGVMYTMKQGTRRNFQIDYSAAVTGADNLYTFPGVVTGINYTVTPGEAMSGSVTIREATDGTWSEEA